MFQHFLQIWLLPKFSGIRPSYEQKHFDPALRGGQPLTVVSPTGEAGSLSINADASIEAGLFDAGETARKAHARDRLAYVHVAQGEVTVNGHALLAGDAVLLDGEAQLDFSGRGADVLVFDLARR